MKRSIKTLMAVAFLATVSWSVQAQTRYVDEVFTDVDVTQNVKYAENFTIASGSPVLQDLVMDVYEPNGDVAGNPLYDGARPVIILLHAGSFLPKGALLPFGDKNDSAQIEMAMQFAKRGFVAVSANYRIGWNPLGSTQDIRSSSIINAVYRAMQDARSCIRFFRKDADTDNNYNIDPYRVAIGGTNSGGYVSLAVGAFNKDSEAELLKFRNSTTGDLFIDQTVTGGFWGQGGDPAINNSSNEGYSSVPQVVLNLGGAVGDTTWMEVGEPPVVSLHGVADPLTPFETGLVIVSATGDPVVIVSGGGSVAERQNNLGNNQMWKDASFSDPVTGIANSRNPAYEGLFWFGASNIWGPASANGYEPWSWYDPTNNNIIGADTAQNTSTPFPPPYPGFGSAANPYANPTKARMYIDSIMQYFIPRALVAFDNVDSAAVETADPISVGISSEFVNVSLDVFPNPTTDKLNILLNDNTMEMSGVEVYDLSGRMVLTRDASGKQNTIDVSSLQTGVYHVTINFSNGQKSVERIIVE